MQETKGIFIKRVYLFYLGTILNTNNENKKTLIVRINGDITKKVLTRVKKVRFFVD